jgi:hypothetical protein
VKRVITGFHLDEQGHWVAELDCGHTVHMRHQPPFTVRAWTLTEAGRSSMVGTEIDCVRCQQLGP